MKDGMQRKKAVHTIESLLARTVEEGECHLWQGYFGNGVPMVHAGRMEPVRKVLWQLQGKKVREGYYTASCGHKDCVAPDHIQFRTHAQHMKAMAKTEFTLERRLRMTQVRRSRGDTVLSEEVAREIRLADGSYREIGAKHGVTKAIVSRIKRGVLWQETASPWAGLMR